MMDHMNQEPLDLPAALALLREARDEVARLRSAENALDAKRYYWSQGIEPWSLGAAPTPLQFPERGDAVNLARNWLDEQGPNPSGYVLESVAYDITNKGIRILAEAVMLMDAWILEVTKHPSAELPDVMQEALAITEEAVQAQVAELENAAPQASDSPTGIASRETPSVQEPAVAASTTDQEREGVTLAQIKREVRKMDRNVERDSEPFRAAVCLLAAIQVGASTKAIARFTRYPEPMVEKFSRNLRQSGVWKDDKTICEWFEPNGGGIAFWMDVAVAQGFMERT